MGLRAEIAAGDYQENGYAVLRRFTPEKQIDAYIAARGREPDVWSHPTPYMHEATIRDLCCSTKVTAVLTRLLGEEPVLHLNLTGFVSTQRAWHQDGYLNPPEVGDAYLAVWFALGDIHPDSGPFECVPASHKWPRRLSRDDALAMGTLKQRADPEWHTMWPTWTQEAVAAHWETVIAEHTAEPVRFVPASKGDVLVWSPWLVHRGTIPNVPGMERPALIAHYSGVNHRPDMPARARYKGSGLFAVLPTEGRTK